MRIWIAFLLATVLAACAGAATRPLHVELGGKAGISAIVDGLIRRVVADPRIGHFFEHTDLQQLHERLVEQICVEADGPCVYAGQEMPLAHAGLSITDADFNALVEALIESMEAEAVPQAAQNRLLRKLARMHGDVVYQ